MNSDRKGSALICNDAVQTSRFDRTNMIYRMEKQIGFGNDPHDLLGAPPSVVHPVHLVNPV